MTRDLELEWSANLCQHLEEALQAASGRFADANGFAIYPILLVVEEPREGFFYGADKFRVLFGPFFVLNLYLVKP